MKIKNILTTCLVCCGFTTVLTSCNNGDAFFTADADDAPRILNTDFPAAGFSINRDENLKFDVLVTPADYTTIKWVADGKVVYVGRTIDQPFEAGDYTLKILATTVKGKETSRTMKLTVKPLDSDPQIKKAKKNRWLNPGVALTIEGSNLVGVKSLVFSPVVEETATRADEPVVEGGDIEVSCQAAEDGNSVTATLPSEMTNGSYRVSAVKDNGERFGCGIVTVTDEEWVDPGVNTIYEGPSEKLSWSAIKWEGEEYAKLGITPGMTISVYVNADADAVGAIATGWWRDINTGNQWDAPEGGCRHELPQGQSVMTYTVTTTEFMEEQGFAVIGNNFVVEKITFEEPQETVIYEGPSDKLAWGAIKWEGEEFAKLGIKAGTIIIVYYVADEGAAGAIATSWWRDINTGTQWDEEGGCRQELPAGSGKMEYEVTTLDYLNEQGLGIIGNGYVVEKVTIK